MKAKMRIRVLWSICVLMLLLLASMTSIGAYSDDAYPAPYPVGGSALRLAPNVNGAPATRTPEYFRLKYQTVLDNMHFQDEQHQAWWGGAPVDQVRKDNDWWLTVLSQRLSAQAGFNATNTPFTPDVLARYAFTWSQDWAARHFQMCADNIKRDFAAHGKFPSVDDFEKCKVTDKMWNDNYKQNIADTQYSFDNAPNVYADVDSGKKKPEYNQLMW